ncbi:MAG: hypothetical protein WAM14_17580 [Candidatus Nitrosopolaris sp.]
MVGHCTIPSSSVLKCFVDRGLFREEKHEGSDYIYWRTDKLKSLCPEIVNATPCYRFISRRIAKIHHDHDPSSEMYSTTFAEGRNSWIPWALYIAHHNIYFVLELAL